MIKRYSRPEIDAVWTEQNKLECWLKVELAVCEAWSRRGKIPPEALAVIQQKAGFDLERVQTIEETVRHDVIAFLTSVAEHVGAEARYIHLGMTSSDVLDTALALQIKEAGSILLEGCGKLRKSLAEKAKEFRDLPAIGRSHGIHAEPVVFGLRFARFYEQLTRATTRLENAWKTVCVGKLSGAVGCYVHLDPEMEEEVMNTLELGVAPISSQVVSRDRHADFLAAIALTGAVLESIAIEIRHLQRTEVGEAREGFSKGQKGSSAMPHKRNPIDSEKISGMARLLRGNMHVAFENIALWHERDISHSSVERVIFPDSTIALDYLLSLTKKVVDNLVVDREKIAANLEITGGAISSEGLLLEMIEQGMSREDAYAIVQKIAHEALENKENMLEAALKESQLVELIGEDKIRRTFDIDHTLRNVDFIYKRMGW
ncbi:MAG: adenylosuccinate lyase [Candidatus Electryonea clarkiae]|nr:adenylosuccinate lyase [Candidatus Electryonea clarkiae]MDP8286344.1 adenylosuccinate lyase [Candidatus Electryonea clarkiae]